MINAARGQRLLLPLLVVSVVLLWQSPVIYPLKLLVIFFHEMSHALMALVTGGRVYSMEVNRLQGGLVQSSGGSRFLILTAGYLGSLFWGALIYLLALHSSRDRWIAALLGVVLLTITLLFVRNGFGVVFGLLSGVALLLLARFGQPWLNDLVLRLIGITSLLYVPLDIISDTLLRSHLLSDARMLAEEFGGSTILWGILWLVISLIVIYWVLRSRQRIELKSN
ncbi:M50 family peptidase [Ectothiorhodospiraceae bacterium BW-2]|nr:M50 family peptidase [Ectothiorhodospiraceae bacterium BW-2]